MQTMFVQGAMKVMARSDNRVLSIGLANNNDVMPCGAIYQNFLINKYCSLEH